MGVVSQPSLGNRFNGPKFTPATSSGDSGVEINGRALDIRKHGHCLRPYPDRDISVAYFMPLGVKFRSTKLMGVPFGHKSSRWSSKY